MGESVCVSVCFVCVGCTIKITMTTLRGENRFISFTQFKLKKTLDAKGTRSSTSPGLFGAHCGREGRLSESVLFGKIIFNYVWLLFF